MAKGGNNKQGGADKKKQDKKKDAAALDEMVKAKAKEVEAKVQAFIDKTDANGKKIATKLDSWITQSDANAIVKLYKGAKPATSASPQVAIDNLSCILHGMMQVLSPKDDKGGASHKVYSDQDVISKHIQSLKKHLNPFAEEHAALCNGGHMQFHSVALETFIAAEKSSAHDTAFKDFLVSLSKPNDSFLVSLSKPKDSAPRRGDMPNVTKANDMLEVVRHVLEKNKDDPDPEALKEFIKMSINYYIGDKKFDAKYVKSATNAMLNNTDWLTEKEKEHELIKKQVNKFQRYTDYDKLRETVKSRASKFRRNSQLTQSQQNIRKLEGDVEQETVKAKNELMEWLGALKSANTNLQLGVDSVEVADGGDGSISNIAQPEVFVERVRDAMKKKITEHNKQLQEFKGAELTYGLENIDTAFDFDSKDGVEAVMKALLDGRKALKNAAKDVLEAMQKELNHIAAYDDKDNTDLATAQENAAALEDKIKGYGKPEALNSNDYNQAIVEFDTVKTDLKKAVANKLNECYKELGNFAKYEQVKQSVPNADTINQSLINAKKKAADLEGKIKGYDKPEALNSINYNKAIDEFDTVKTEMQQAAKVALEAMQAELNAFKDYDDKGNTDLATAKQAAADLAGKIEKYINKPEALNSINYNKAIVEFNQVRVNLNDELNLFAQKIGNDIAKENRLVAQGEKKLKDDIADVITVIGRLTHNNSTNLEGQIKKLKAFEDGDDKDATTEIDAYIVELKKLIDAEKAAKDAIKTTQAAITEVEHENEKLNKLIADNSKATFADIITQKKALDTALAELTTAKENEKSAMDAFDGLHKQCDEHNQSVQGAINQAQQDLKRRSDAINILKTDFDQKMTEIASLEKDIGADVNSLTNLLKAANVLQKVESGLDGIDKQKRGKIAGVIDDGNGMQVALATYKQKLGDLVQQLQAAKDKIDQLKPQNAVDVATANAVIVDTKTELARLTNAIPQEVAALKQEQAKIAQFENDLTKAQASMKDDLLKQLKDLQILNKMVEDKSAELLEYLHNQSDLDVVPKSDDVQDAVDKVGKVHNTANLSNAKILNEQLEFLQQRVKDVEKSVKTRLDKIKNETEEIGKFEGEDAAIKKINERAKTSVEEIGVLKGKLNTLDFTVELMEYKRIVNEYQKTKQQLLTAVEPIVSVFGNIFNDDSPADVPLNIQSVIDAAKKLCGDDLNQWNAVVSLNSNQMSVDALYRALEWKIKQIAKNAPHDNKKSGATKLDIELGKACVKQYRCEQTLEGLANTKNVDIKQLQTAYTKFINAGKELDRIKRLRSLGANAQHVASMEQEIKLALETFYKIKQQYDGLPSEERAKLRNIIAECKTQVSGIYPEVTPPDGLKMQRKPPVTLQRHNMRFNAANSQGVRHW